jgi:hypothetical protein
MSKKCKLNNRLEHLQEKRSRKAANKAKYAELKRLGMNGKSKRFLSNKRKNRIVGKVDHPFGNCGNVGCKKCFPDLYQVKMVLSL